MIHAWSWTWNTRLKILNLKWIKKTEKIEKEWQIVDLLHYVLKWVRFDGWRILRGISKETSLRNIEEEWLRERERNWENRDSQSYSFCVFLWELMDGNKLEGLLQSKRCWLIVMHLFFFHSDIGKRKVELTGTRTFDLDSIKIQTIVAIHNFFLCFSK